MRAHTMEAIDSGLQCGHGHEAVENFCVPRSAASPKACFNAATAMRPWRTISVAVVPTATVRLQCGHGHEAVENACTNSRVRSAAEKASMRPRP